MDKFIGLLSQISPLETSHIEYLLGYRCRKTVQKHLQKLKKQGLIKSVRVGNNHFWYITYKGVSYAKRKLRLSPTHTGDHIMLAGEVKRNYSVTNAFMHFVMNSNHEELIGVTSYVDNELAYYMQGKSGTFMLYINTLPDFPKQPTMVIMDKSLDKVWDISRNYLEYDVPVIFTTFDLFYSHNPFSNIWLVNIDSADYYSLEDVGVETTQSIHFIGGKAWIRLISGED